MQKYSCSAELRGNSGSYLTRIGVICHEFGHVLGAPDYYDVDYTTGGSFEGMGDWCIMAGGSWNNNGATPAHHNGFTKVALYDWATATTLIVPPMFYCTMLQKIVIVSIDLIPQQTTILFY